MSEIWAVLEHHEGTFSENTGELLAELADIAQRQQSQAVLCAVVLTSPDTHDTTHLDTTFLTT